MVENYDINRTIDFVNEPVALRQNNASVLSKCLNQI